MATSTLSKKRHSVIYTSRPTIDRLPKLNSKFPSITQQNAFSTNRQSLNNSTTTKTQRHLVRRHTIQHGGRLRTFTVPRLQEYSRRMLFRRIIRLVQILCRVCIAIRRYAVNKNDNRVSREFHNYLHPLTTDNLPDSIANNGPYFNKHMYSVENNHSFPSWARVLCSRPTHYRSEEDLTRLRCHLRGHKSFAQFDCVTQMMICRNVLYNRYDRKRIILNQGDNPEYWYIMICGSVYVNISHRDKNTGIEITETTDELSGHCSFGSNALMYETKRTASIVCNSFVEVLLIDSEVFLKYCLDVLIKQHEKQKLFLHSHEIFRSWSNRQIKLLSYDVKCMFYRSGKVIDVDAVNSKYIYFVIHGTVDIYYKNESDEKGWLHSNKLNRYVGILGGNRISAPNPCNLTSLFKSEDKGTEFGHENIKILLISNGATILYVPRSRFEDIAPKLFLRGFEAKFEFLRLSDVEYKRETQKAVKWMEFRDQTTVNTIKSSTKVNNVILPKLTR